MFLFLHISNNSGTFSFSNLSILKNKIYIFKSS
jgi:hypothetical protein